MKKLAVNKNIKNYFLSSLSDELFVRLLYLYTRKEILYLNHPRTMSEKIQWLKIYGELDQYSNLVDKFEVREYIKNTIGEQHLTKLIGVWNSFDDIPFDELPDKFVLKATHGSGYNYICTDKNSLDIVSTKRQFDKWLTENFYAISREPQYRNCVPRIVCEEYIEDESGALIDYKIFCCDGVPVLVQVDSGRYLSHKRDLMTINWSKLPVLLAHPNLDKPLIKPNNLNEMLKLAGGLSKGISFVRVDFYSVNGRTIFSELTFTPGSGLEIFTPKSFDFEIGSKINIIKK